MAELTKLEGKSLIICKNREKWVNIAFCKKNREKSGILSLSGDSREIGLKIVKIPTKSGELTGMDGHDDCTGTLCDIPVEHRPLNVDENDFVERFRNYKTCQRSPTSQPP